MEAGRFTLVSTIAITAVFAAAVASGGSRALASTVPDPKSSCASSENNSPADAGPDELKVVPITNPILNTSPQVVSMGKQVTVCVMGLYKWTYEQKNQPSTLRLSIGGHVLETIAPSTVGPPEQEYLNYIIRIDSASSPDWKEWAAILEAARDPQNGQKRQLISVAVMGTKQLSHSSFYADVQPYPEHSFLLFLLFPVLLAALVILAKYTDLLRFVIGVYPDPPNRPPFSLGLVQMAFWFYLVVAAYVYICTTTTQVSIPIGSALGLLGISSTTGLAAVFVDKQKNDPTERNNLLAEQATVKPRVDELTAKQTTAPLSQDEQSELSTKKSRLSAITARLAELAPAVTQGFLTDILSDGDAVSFHRFQIAIWTIVLGAVFVWSVYRNLSMPEFDASLLTLMGISSGTYVGFKFPEKSK
jgi:hypothetical protein